MNKRFDVGSLIALLMLVIVVLEFVRVVEEFARTFR